jgi:teichuronic acid biosynthesis glycosyltransferase TuaG
MKSSVVSIIMPAYNAGAFISQAIESVLAQTIQNWELIIVNDGSTDNTSAVVLDYCLKDDRIIFFEKENEKQAVARNFALTKAKGELIAFLDADDVWLSNRLELGLLHFNTHVFDLIFFDAHYSNEKGRMSIIESKRMGVKDYIYTDDNGLRRFVSSNQIPILTVLVKRSKILEAGGFDPKLVPAEDYDLWIRLIKSGSKFLSISTPVAIYRFQSSSSTAHDRFAAKQVIQILNKNISKKEFDELRLYSFIKHWLVRAISLSQSRDPDFETYKRTLQRFNLLGKKMTLLFAIRPFIPKFTFIRMFNRFL